MSLAPYAAAVPARTWNRRYLFLGLALLPLAWSVIHPTKEEDFEQQLESTLEQCSESERSKVMQAIQGQDASLDKILAAIPGDRLKGAYLARNSWRHWIFAFLSAAAFFTFIVLAFPDPDTSPHKLLMTGLFTGTVGILMLLALQYIAMFSQVLPIRGGGIIGLFILILKFIAFSYNAAEDPANNFFLSFIGYTCGVGFCEELCKALPILSHFRSKAKMGWRGACVWGLASGVGFGVSEAIMYSSHYYNGITTSNIYVIRFVSCVALHAIWCGAAAISVWKKQFSIQGQLGFVDLLLPVIMILGVPMILHGLYDTLLKQSMELPALVVAFVSMAWLALQIETAKKLENDPDYNTNVPPALRF